MRKLIIAAALTALLLTGCGSAAPETAYRETTGVGVDMVRIANGYHWDIYVHRQTGVMYGVYTRLYRGGGPVMLVNSDGSPMIWEGGE